MSMHLPVRSARPHIGGAVLMAIAAVMALAACSSGSAGGGGIAAGNPPAGEVATASQGTGGTPAPTVAPSKSMKSTKPPTVLLTITPTASAPSGATTTTPATGPATTPASTLSGFVVIKKDYNVPAGSYVRGNAVCPAGTVVLGGGAAVLGLVGDEYVSVKESAPGTLNGGAVSEWLANVGTGGNYALQIEITAVCADSPPGYTVVKAPISAAAGQYVRSVADCPSGTVVLSGGVYLGDPVVNDTGTRIQESAPGTSGGGAVSLWEAAFQNGSQAAHTNAQIDAVCAAKPSGYALEATQYPVGSQTIKLASASCNGGEAAVGGGPTVVGEGDGNFTLRLQESFPLSPSEQAWEASIVNYGSSAHNVRFYAVCIKS